MKFLNKISVWTIIKSHWRTLVNDQTKKMEFDDVLTFIITPIVVATGLILGGVLLNDTATNIIITSFSIFVGLLFNVIVLIFDIVNRSTDEEKKDFLKQILSNISFAILVSIIAIVFCLISFSKIWKINPISNWVIYFLSTVFLFTVLMILKRIYALFTTEIDETTPNP